MTTALRPRTFVLFVGDICFFIFSLWLSLFLRTFEVPSQALFLAHLSPFSLLFIAWAAVFFIAGLYESRSIILERRAISATLLVAQIINLTIAALFFFFIPSFGIAPKTLLVIYLIVSFCLVLLWRAFLFPLMSQRSESAIMIGESAEVEELVRALNAARRAPAKIVAVIAPSQASEAIEEAIRQFKPRFIIADFNDERVAKLASRLLNYIALGVRFFDAISLYEEVFGRIALSYIDDAWVARNVSRYSFTLYDVFKRTMDIVIALPAALLSLILYPFILAAIKLDDGGSIFIRQDRIGQDGEIIHNHKFRSMQRNDLDLASASHRENKVTRVGSFLRKSRLDEFPQLWDVVMGRLSLIGPRPELPSGVALYEREIPYYGVRHLVRPGLSGWAQLYGQHAHHGVGIEETRNKFSYDLYYIKHRSLLLDVTIALKTVKKLLTRSGA